MVDKFYFTICLLGICFVCTWLGWGMGYCDAKEKYGRKPERRAER